MYGFNDFATSDAPGATDFDGIMRQTIMTFADASTRDTELTGVLEEGLVTRTLDDDTFWAYTGAAWEIVMEREKTWSSTSIVQPTAVTHTVNWGSYKRSYGRWDGMLKVTFTAAGTGGNAIGIATPFDVVGVSGSFAFFDDSLGLYRTGFAIGVADDTIGLIIDLGADLFGIAASDGITADDVLWLDVHGSY
jgi:CubicO group peptidase (beta-lactamase class C family)